MLAFVGKELTQAARLAPRFKKMNFLSAEGLETEMVMSILKGSLGIRIAILWANDNHILREIQQNPLQSFNLSLS
jgi:hypothetical protein